MDSLLRNKTLFTNSAGAQIYAGDGTTGVYVWGAKFNRGVFDPYVSTSNATFYSDNDFNIKNYVLDALDGYFEQALNQTLLQILHLFLDLSLMLMERYYVISYKHLDECNSP